jgi:hypothetical protein
MVDESFEVKKTKLRDALLSLDKKGELGRIAAATGISGGVETLREMINNPSKIGFMDIGMIGIHIGLEVC